ncbi:MAG TPA: hypothetical protein PKC45_10280 [Gemmatales bacterium]|nr:hypothetical protein [Gemmatales bacterium]
MAPKRVVKAGGSLLMEPGIGPWLARWLNQLPADPPILVVGGGPFADVIRQADAAHGLGDRAAHWLAIDAMGLAAELLVQLLPDACLVRELAAVEAALDQGCWPVLLVGDALRRRPDALPHSWDVTSDSIAAWLALEWSVPRLTLLKRRAAGPPSGPREWAAAGLVDPYFPTLASRLDVELLDFSAKSSG